MKLRLTAMLVPIVALTLAVGACSRSNDTASQRMAARTPTSPSTPSAAAPSSPAPATSSDSSSSAPPPSSDASGPPQSSSSTGVNSAETAKANDAPMGSMDKEQETKAMPQPGQANDHSTLAQDPKTPK